MTPLLNPSIGNLADICNKMKALPQITGGSSELSDP